MSTSTTPRPAARRTPVLPPQHGAWAFLALELEHPLRDAPGGGDHDDDHDAGFSQAFAAIEPEARDALEADIYALLDAFNVASDGTLSSSQAVTVSVTDVAPTISSGAAGSVTEGAAAGTTVYTAAATDPAGGTVSYSLSGADAASSAESLTYVAGSGVEGTRS